jgi:hypothetical protein
MHTGDSRRHLGIRFTTASELLRETGHTSTWATRVFSHRRGQASDLLTADVAFQYAPGKIRAQAIYQRGMLAEHFSKQVGTICIVPYGRSRYLWSVFALLGIWSSPILQTTICQSQSNLEDPMNRCTLHRSQPSVPDVPLSHHVSDDP